MLELKVCCISSLEEAQLAIAAGATALGLVSHMPSGPGVISEALIAEIAASVPPHIETFLLTSLCEPDDVIAQHRRLRTTAIQLCDALPRGAHATLHAALPGVRLVQVIHVTGEASYDEAIETVRDGADTLLLDSGNPALAVKELGGTGRVHDWSVSRRIAADAGVPVFLAGGLSAANVLEAIDAVRPSGLDICSGVRTSGHLDREKLRAYVERVRDYNPPNAI